MIFGYLLFTFIFVSSIFGIIKLTKQKDTLGLVAGIFVILFAYGLFIVFLFGGSALHNAADDYELYQAEHYYLVSHGIWNEVSHGVYLFVLISEIIGFSSFIPAFALNIFHVMKRQS